LSRILRQEAGQNLATNAAPLVCPNDNTFTPSPSSQDPKSYTLYKRNTPSSQVDIAVNPPALTLDAARQKITPLINVVSGKLDRRREPAERAGQYLRPQRVGTGIPRQLEISTTAIGLRQL
jgi:hypothetical protein